MTKITDQEISRIAKLSMLDIPEGEYARLKQDMGGIIEMVDKLGELEIDPQFDRYTGEGPYNVFRAAEVRPSAARELLLANAPSQEQGCFFVPKIVE